MKSVPIAVATNLGLELLTQAIRISLMVSAAQAENRASLKPDELKLVKDARDAAFARLDAAINTSEAGK